MRLPLIAATLLLACATARADVACPLKPDPPPSIDGSMAKWYPNPCPISVGGDQVALGKEKWKGENDLSGTLYLYWDANYLYVAAEVIKPKVNQDQSGDGMWNGDHIELFLDTAWNPGVKGSFGPGQFQFGISPGSLTKTGDALFDLPPEVVIAFPEGMAPTGMRAAALRSEKGYNIEAAIPWTALKVVPKEGMVIGLDLCISGSLNPGSQDMMTSLVPGPWRFRQRDHLVPMKLCNTQGK